jgi:acetyl esterase/lipase
VNIERRTFLGSGLALLAASAAAADDYKNPAIVAAEPGTPLWPPKERVALWPGTPPGAPHPLPTPGWQMFPDGPQLWVKGIAVPEVNVFRPALADGSALLVIPGGSYTFHAVQNEGLHPAERFNAERTTVFVLSYRLPDEGWVQRSTVALADAQRAMRLIRARAREFKIDPNRLGVLGFSAGGHLAADLTVSYDQPLYAPVDAADRLSARPAFTGLIYPVMSLDTAISQGDSVPNLLGPNASPELVAARSPAPHVKKDTPPSFVAAALDDGFILPENSLQWIAACRKAGATVEAHLFAEGGHGFGLHLPPSNPGSRWPDLFALWMRKHGG